MSGAGRAATPALARRHEVTADSGATPTLPGLPAGPQCIDCGKPVQQRPGAAAPKRCPEHARERNRERDRARKKHPKCRERERERKRTPEYRERNRERERERRRTPEYRGRDRNRERARKRTPGYRKRKRERDRERRSTRNLLVSLIVRQGALCALCGNRLPEDAADIHVDHIVPVARGGTSDPENLQAVCADCNLRKGAN